MNCIFCGKENDAKSIEHIVSESLGNTHYLMPYSSVCDVCNQKFSSFEDKALSKSILAMERSRFAVKTKKKHTSKGQINGLKIEGNEDFKKGLVYVGGMNPDNFRDFDPVTRLGSLRIPTFDKSEVATSKFLLKIGLESLFKSQKAIYDRYDFKDLKEYLNSTNNIDWPFCTTDFEIHKFSSVPKMTDKYRLKHIHCLLKFLEVDNETFLFKFRYGGILMTINLLCRSLKWIQDIYDIKDEKYTSDFVTIFPEHYRKKIRIRPENQIEPLINDNP